tara:strand:- start:9220 stop:10284 length:1065 start_codon:yes stop_codon:yes gene_type:complete
MTHILLIEDNKDIREMTAGFLELKHFQVTTAIDGLDGIAKTQEVTPDLIICDVMMPKMDGFDVFEALRNNLKTATIPFIFLTAKSEIADIRKGMNLGADDYLTKPFEAEELIDAIASRLKISEFLKKSFSQNIAGVNAFFKEASQMPQLQDLSSNRELIAYKHNEDIYQKDKQANHIYFIAKGHVKTYQVTETGKEFVCGMFGKGDFIGQLSLLDNSGTYMETATAMESEQVCQIPKEDFTKLLFNNIEVSNKFIMMMSKNTIKIQEQLVDMAFSSVRKRAAKALLQLLDKGIISKQSHISINVPREDFAGMIGTATETAIRTLTDFKDEGIIKIEDSRTILLLNEKKLREIAK